MKRTFTTKALLALVAIGSSAFLSAQTVIKVGASETAYQKTIQLAYDSIVPATIEGAYIIELQSDYDPTGETYPITIKSKIGASATNNIVIKPAAGVKKTIGPANKTFVFDNLTFASGASEIVLPSVTGITVGMSLYGSGVPAFLTNFSYIKVAEVDVANSKIILDSPTTGAFVSDKKLFVGDILTQAIVFNAAKYVTIDGVSRTGDTGLTIQNPNSINCQTIMLTGSSEYISIKNCIIRGANVSGIYNNGTQGTVFFSNASNISFTQNDICDMDDPAIPFPITAFQMTGVGTNSFNTISENNIYNISNFYSTNGNSGFFQFGSGGGQGTVITNNKIFWSKPTFIGNSVNVIGVGGGMNGLGNRFEGNTIGYSAPDGTGISTLTTTVASTLKGMGNMRNFIIRNNTVANIEFVGVNFTAIELASSVAQTIDPDAVCYNNLVENITLVQTNSGTLTGILVGAANPYDVNVKNNTVRNLRAESMTATHNSIAYGINFSGTANVAYKFKYINNKVSNISAGNSTSNGNNVSYGMRVPFNTSVVEKNLIYNISTTNADAKAIVRGLQTAGSNVTGQLIANNIVRVGTDVTSDATIHAFFQEVATSAGDVCKVYNNTFYVGGQAPAAATKSTFAYFRPTGNAPALDFQNNIFANKRTVAAQESHYAIQINAGTEFTKSNNNLFQYGGNMGYVTTLTAAAPTLAIWQAGVELDANSVDGNPMFAAPDAAIPDMSIGENSAARGVGANLTTTVADDFLGRTRTTNDIGAMSYVAISGLSNTKYSNSLEVKVLNNGVSIEAQNGKTAHIYGLSGQLIKTELLNSDSEIVKLNKGFYIIKVDALNAKVLIK